MKDREPVNMLTEVSIKRPTVRQMMVLGYWIAIMSGGDDESDICGLCHILLNRAIEAIEHITRYKSPHPIYGSGGWLEVCVECCPEQIDFDQAFTNVHAQTIAAFCHILTGRGSDPTFGATLFHKHWIEPEWAATARPTSSAFNLMFYRP
ncbi:MAG: hypothetical protein R8J41_14310 [Alphaproteobacteria bacterium]|nr:hypothetical protein [Alphaproteobacteria bacterium]